jgi:hypothetical protein
MTELEIVKGDINFPLFWTIKYPDGSVFDLIGASLELKVQKVGSATLWHTFTGSIVEANLGTCSFLIDTAFDTVGFYNAEITVTQGSRVLKVPNISIRVISDLPK